MAVATATYKVGDLYTSQKSKVTGTITEIKPNKDGNSVRVKLETMKLMDGVTVLEADAFEPEMEVFVVTEDDQKIPVPVGEYETEDGRILVVEVEGMIKSPNNDFWEEEYL